MIRLRAALIVTLSWASSSPLGAQWLHYPTPGIPRTLDGKPNLAAPAPRTTSGKPDFSGLWERRSDKYYNNIAADLKPGDVQPWAEALYQQRKRDFGKNSMEAQCLPMGPAYSTTPYRESRIIQTPTMLAMLNEDLTFRQIYMDGRELEKDPNPTWMGYSVGHWDGDTLVVESNGFSESTWLDVDGHPHTEGLRMTERYRRPDIGHIELQITLEDPKAYAKPWTVPVTMDLKTDTEMLEYTCDNEKDRKHMPANAKVSDLKLSVETLATYAGSYDVQDSGKTVIAEITLEGDTLFWNYGGTGKQRLDPVAETIFSLAGSSIEFVRNGPGPVSRCVFRTIESESVGERHK
jgi:hypothetical protein